MHLSSFGIVALTTLASTVLGDPALTSFAPPSIDFTRLQLSKKLRDNTTRFDDGPIAPGGHDHEKRELEAEERCGSVGCPNGSYITVSVHYRVHYYSPDNSTSRANGYISRSDILANLVKLNADYAPYQPQIRFVLGRGLTKADAGIQYIQYTDQTAWNNMVCDPNDTQGVNAAIATNARGPLNSRPANQMNQMFIYVCNQLPGLTIGFAYIPNSPYPFVQDGIFYSQKYFENRRSYYGTYSPHTMSHEAGHFLSLYHTFQDGCGADPSAGDFVADTPNWDNSPSFCPAYQNSQSGWSADQLVSVCTGSNLTANQIQVDVSNMMSYSQELCSTRFTPGQIARAYSALTTYRGATPACL